MSPPPKFVGFGLTVPGMAVKGPSCTMTESTVHKVAISRQHNSPCRRQRCGLMRRRWLPETFVLVVLEDTSSDAAQITGGFVLRRKRHGHQVQITHPPRANHRERQYRLRSTQTPCRTVKRRAEELVEVSPQRFPIGRVVPAEEKVFNPWSTGTISTY